MTIDIDWPRDVPIPHIHHGMSVLEIQNFLDEHASFWSKGGLFFVPIQHPDGRLYGDIHKQDELLAQMLYQYLQAAFSPSILAIMPQSESKATHQG